ncbi:vWA domain-containing protein, partial [Streptomyces cacaoi]|uniref:vWA domain-containing protein n=2 Tax=Streptomyces TaxID=1883 RepID=UPI002620AAE0
SPDAAALDTALRGYRSANGPGRVLYLLDSSGSMGDLWEGPGGAPGILKQSLSALGTKDRFGVWAVSTAPGGDRPYRELLSFGSHTRAEGAEALNRARVTDHEAEPDRALEAAVRELADRGRDDDHPQAVVYLTDGEDNGRLTDDARLRGLEQAVEDEGVPLVVATLDQTGCAPGEPDARLAAAGGGRCLDPGGSTDLAARLRDEVARTGSGETG